MADQTPVPAETALVVSPEPAGEEEATESVASPAKVLRIGSMTKELLEEVRRAPLDDAGRTRLREIYETSVHELAEGLSGDLRAELARLSSPFSADTPSDSELRVAQAQLVGWLEGLFHGIQAALFSQQMAAQAQLQQMRRPGLPPGMPDPSGDNAAARPGTYL
jgi:proteasome activator-like protein